MKSAADDNWGRANVADNGSKHDVDTLAGALVFARLYPGRRAERYRRRVADALMETINTEGGAANTSLGRNLSSYIIAADLINFRSYDSDREARWREWLRSVVNMKVDDRTLAQRHQEVLTNHGTMSGGSRLAAAIYLGNKKEIRRAARVFKGWLGVSSAYDGFSYNGPRDWFCGPRQVGINRECNKRIDGANRKIGGVLATELARGGSATWPPRKTNYVWGSLQGVTMQAELLRRRGFKVLRWGNSALRRAFDRLWRWDKSFGGWWGDGGSVDSKHVPALAVFWYRARPWRQFKNAGKGKNYGWTEWTHGTRARRKK